MRYEDESRRREDKSFMFNLNSFRFKQYQISDVIIQEILCIPPRCAYHTLEFVETSSIFYRTLPETNISGGMSWNMASTSFPSCLQSTEKVSVNHVTSGPSYGLDHVLWVG